MTASKLGVFDQHSVLIGLGQVQTLGRDIAEVFAVQFRIRHRLGPGFSIIHHVTTPLRRHRVSFGLVRPLESRVLALWSKKAGAFRATPLILGPINGRQRRRGIRRRLYRRRSPCLPCRAGPPPGGQDGPFGGKPTVVGPAWGRSSIGLCPKTPPLDRCALSLPGNSPMPLHKVPQVRCIRVRQAAEVAIQRLGNICDTEMQKFGTEK